MGRATLFYILLFNLLPFRFGFQFFRTLSRSKHQLFQSPPTIDGQSVYTQLTEQIKTALEPKISKYPDLAAMASQFIDEYAESNRLADRSPQLFQKNLLLFFQEVIHAIQFPHKFQPFHAASRSPFDYYAWGNDFLRPMIISEQSKLVGKENVDKIEQYLAQGDNIVLFSNHQTEADPQVISVLLESIGKGALAEKIIFVAGHKVTTDPVAIPFSMGRNLICIHSKKHIKNPPEDFLRKQGENLESMKALGELIEKGGSIFWIAPSGGRDRPNETEKFVISPFDPKSIDLFRILAKKATKRTHFFPMAMFTHQLVPPPKSVSSGVGEARSAKRGAVSLHFLPETDGVGGDWGQFTQRMQKSVEEAYEDLYQWHLSRGSN